MSDLMLPEIDEPEDRNARFKYLLMKADVRINPAALNALVELADNFADLCRKRPAKQGWNRKDLEQHLALRGLDGNALPKIMELFIQRVGDETLESWTDEPGITLNTITDKINSPYFKEKAGFLVQDFVRDLITSADLAITAESKIAVYNKGVYTDADWLLLWQTQQMLGNAWKSEHHNEAMRVLKPLLRAKDLVIPNWAPQPVLNVLNGMLDLRTLELRPHSPTYLSNNQVNIVWDPNATATYYHEWLTSCAGDQIDDLEEVVSQMLDQSKTPSKALLLHGASRTGKSTFLNLAKNMAGAENTSAVTLHQLGDDRFAAANLHGKILNVAADISAADVEDIAAFKMLLGDDLIHANRKYGDQFSFTNRAMLAFSCNQIPRVSEGSMAYVARMKPFTFDNTFIGDEDTNVPTRLAAEMPGILVRWAKAWQRRYERGGKFADTDAKVLTNFAASSDRVASFFSEACDKTTDGTWLPTGKVLEVFLEWIKENAGKPMGKQQFNQRMTHLAEPKWRTRGDNATIEGWRVRLRPRDEYLVMPEKHPFS